MELGLVDVADRAGILHAQRKARPKFGESSITNASLKSALRGSASGPSSRPDSVVANHRATEVARPFPPRVQRFSEPSGDFSGAGNCGVAGRPRSGAQRSSGPLIKLPK